MRTVSIDYSGSLYFTLKVKVSCWTQAGAQQSRVVPRLPPLVPSLLYVYCVQFIVSLDLNIVCFAWPSWYNLIRARVGSPYSSSLPSSSSCVPSGKS